MIVARIIFRVTVTIIGMDTDTDMGTDMGTDTDMEGEGVGELGHVTFRHAFSGMGELLSPFFLSPHI